MGPQRTSISRSRRYSMALMAFGRRPASIVDNFLIFFMSSSVRETCHSGGGV
jgi:hypothetical protein